MKNGNKTIIRKARTPENPYAQIYRKSIQNPYLSLKAKGLLAYILSLPDSWRIHIAELVNHFSDGEFAIRSAMKELKKAGHITGKRLKDENGTYCGYEYVIHEDPEIHIDIPDDGTRREQMRRAQERMVDDQATGYGITDESGRIIDNVFN